MLPLQLKLHAGRNILMCSLLYLFFLVIQVLNLFGKEKKKKEAVLALWAGGRGVPLKGSA